MFYHMFICKHKIPMLIYIYFTLFQIYTKFIEKTQDDMCVPHLETTALHNCLLSVYLLCVCVWEEGGAGVRVS